MKKHSLLGKTDKVIQFDFEGINVTIDEKLSQLLQE